MKTDSVKRLAYLLLAVVLMLAMIPNASVGAAGFGGRCGKNTIWSLQDGVLTVSGTGAMADFDPWQAPWFDRREQIRAVVIGDGVSRIGDYAFAGCGSLTDVEIPQGVAEIGSCAFLGCGSLAHITLPEGVTELEGSAFESSGLTRVTLPDGLKRVGDYVFEYCTALEEITIPSSVTDIGYEAFYGCDALARVYYKGSGTQWAAIQIEDDNFALCHAKMYCNWVDSPEITGLQNVENGIKLSWRAVQGAERYRVFIRSDNGWKTVGNTTGTDFVYTGAKSGHTYTFTVRCTNAAGTAFTSFYNTAGWKQTYVAQPEITRLSSTANGVGLQWKAVAGAEKYRVFVKTAKGWKTLGTTARTEFLWTGAQTGKTYHFTVRCVNAGETDYTSSYASPGWKCLYAPAPAVTELKNTDQGIALTWTPVNGAAKYRVFVKADWGWDTVGVTSGTGFVWKNAKAGQTYTFTVRCVNASNTAYTSSYYAKGWSIQRSE